MTDSSKKGEKGLIRRRNGIGRFPDRGIWIADDRILAFFSQESGGLTRLIYHGKQPQSANAFLLQQPAGALKWSFVIESIISREVIPHQFQRMQIWPYGWVNEFQQAGCTFQTTLCARGKAITWQIRCRNQRFEPVWITPVFSLDPDSLNFKVNGHRAWSDPQVRQGVLYLAARDQLQTSSWINVSGFKDQFIDAETHLLIAGAGDQARCDGMSLSLSAEEISPGQWGESFYFFVVCESTRTRAELTLAQLRAVPEAAWQEQSARYLARSASSPRLRVSGHPVASAVYRLAPQYTEAMKVMNSGALRSSAGGYYFVWGWDSLMGGHELNRWGDSIAAQRLLDFISTHLAEDGSVPHRFDNDLEPLQVTGFDFISQLFISLLYHYYSETLDIATLNRCYPTARKIFERLMAQVDERGFYPTLGMYPDAPLKLGRSPQSLVAYENGFFYTICRMMEVLAQIQDDDLLSQAASGLASRLQRTFLTEFYDPQRGFLVDAVDGVSGKHNGTYPRYSLFPLHNAFGAWLLRPVIKNLSGFIQHELFKTDGIRMVPEWDAHIGTETVTSGCWFLHFDFYCLKAFRRAGDRSAIERWLRLADAYFQYRGVIPELQMMAADEPSRAGWKGITGQIWQLFALSGWSRGLLEGVVGLEMDHGGLTYIPCSLSNSIDLRNLPFRGGRWNVSITGSGEWVSRFAVDSQSVQGSLKIPGEFYTTGSHLFEVERSQVPPLAPLLLEAVGGTVLSPKIEKARLMVKIQADNQVNLVFYCPTSPRVWVDGQIQSAEWDANSGIGTLDISIHGIHGLEIAET